MDLDLGGRILIATITLFKLKVLVTQGSISITFLTSVAVVVGDRAGVHADVALQKKISSNWPN